MIVAQRWVYEKQEYIQCILPDGCTTISNKLDDEIVCAQCNKTIAFGESYCSWVIHTPVYGLGYCVCPECHEKEMEEGLKYKDKG